MTYIFDELEVVKDFQKDNDTSGMKCVLINTPLDTDFIAKYEKEKDKTATGREVVVDGIYFDEVVGTATDVFGFRIFQYFTLFDCHDDYKIFTRNAKQYEVIVSDEKIFDVVGDEIYPHETSLETLCEKGVCNPPMNKKLVNGEFIDMTFSEIQASGDKDGIKSFCENEIQNAKNYLNETDYVVAKIAEGACEKEKYSNELQKRKEARETINEYEAILFEVEGE